MYYMHADMYTCLHGHNDGNARSNMDLRVSDHAIHQPPTEPAVDPGPERARGPKLGADVPGIHRGQVVGTLAATSRTPV